MRAIEGSELKNLVSLVFKLLAIIAILFAALYLFRLDATTAIPKPDWFSSAMSLLLLFVVFFIKAFIWHRLLIRFHIHIGFKNAFTSQSKSILLKYIPGKIWGLLGRANIVAGLGFSLEYCSFVSAFCQFLMTATGLFIGMLGVILFEFFPIPPLAAFILLGILLAALLICSRENTIPSLTSNRLPGKIKDFSGKRIPPVADIILLSAIHWLFMGEAFLLFFKSLGYNPGLCPLLLQPLANNIGIISYFAPGGLGVREGVMIGYLAMAHIPLAGATSIALASRIWFFVAEAVTYALGYIIK
jgi:uncharacterized membrane protein YbhN (UPF0104 family)